VAFCKSFVLLPLSTAAFPVEACCAEEKSALAKNIQKAMAARTTVKCLFISLSTAESNLKSVQGGRQGKRKEEIRQINPTRIASR
jgi:hypothetical protein